LFSPDVPYYTGDTHERLTNFDVAAPFTFTWNGYTPAAGITDAPIFFSILRVSDGQPVGGTIVSNSTTSYVLPAGALAPETQYRASLDYSSRQVTFDAGFGDADATALYDLVTEITFTTAPILPGDYNRNHAVDAADYTVWRNTLGQMNVPPFAGADGNGDGKILAADYDVWKANYGNSSPAAGASNATVPEPAAWLLAGVGWAIAASFGRAKRIPPRTCP
jgi:hypothetical protein